MPYYKKIGEVNFADINHFSVLDEHHHNPDIKEGK